MPRSPQWSLSVRFPHQDPIHSPLLTHTCHMPSPSHLELATANLHLQEINNRDNEIRNYNKNIQKICVLNWGTPSKFCHFITNNSYTCIYE
jgi:hypothetical protein